MLEIYSDWVIPRFTKKLPKGKPIIFRPLGYQFQNFPPDFWRFLPHYRHDLGRHDISRHQAGWLEYVVLCTPAPHLPARLEPFCVLYSYLLYHYSLPL